MERDLINLILSENKDDLKLAINILRSRGIKDETILKDLIEVISTEVSPMGDYINDFFDEEDIFEWVESEESKPGHIVIVVKIKKEWG